MASDELEEYDELEESVSDSDDDYDDDYEIMDTVCSQSMRMKPVELDRGKTNS